MLRRLRALVGDVRAGRHTRRSAGNARLGARPRIEGHPLLDVTQLEVGDDLLLWSHEAVTRLSGSGHMVIGDRVFINSGVLVIANNYVRIGDDVAVGFQAVIVDSQMHGLAGAPVRHERTVIGDGSWIGMRAMVLAGTTIGRRCVVGAGAVVTRDVPDDTVVAGNPARVLRKIEYPDGCRKAWNNDWKPGYWSDGGHAPGPA